MKAYLLALLSLSLWSSWSLALDHAVHVSIVDGRSVTEARVRRTDKYILKNYPQLHLHQVEVRLNGRVPDDDLYALIRDRVADLRLGEDQRVKLLIVNVPSEAAVAQTLSPLEGRLGRYARVVLLGHQELDATDPASVARLEGLMATLGASSGSLFALETPPRTEVSAGLGARRLRWITGAALGAATLAATVAAAHGEWEGVVPMFMSIGGVTWGSLAIVNAVVDRVRPWVAVLTRRADVGRLLRLEDGGVRAQERFSALRRARVFSCVDRLSL